MRFYFLLAAWDTSEALNLTAQCWSVCRTRGDISKSEAADAADIFWDFIARTQRLASAKRNLLFGPAVFSHREICLASSGDRRPR